MAKEVIRHDAFNSNTDKTGCYDISNDFTNIVFRKISDFEAEGHWVQSKYNDDF